MGVKKATIGVTVGSKQPKTDIGTDEVHKRHSVLVQGGNIQKAKVMDQMIFDRYLMEGLLSLAQHQACEYILSQATAAGIYTAPLNLSGARSGGNPSASTPKDAVLRFGKTMKIVSDRFGEYASYLVQEVVCHNWDIRSDDKKMKVFKDGLDQIIKRRMAMAARGDPLRHLKKGGR
jgi:hypothetical protein